MDDAWFMQYKQSQKLRNAYNNLLKRTAVMVVSFG